MDKSDQNLAIMLKSLALVLVCILLIAGEAFSQPLELGENNDRVKFEEVVSGLSNPWGMAFTPNADILITEKKGEIRIVRDGVLIDQKVEGVPEIYERGQGGLLDIELHPDFENNRWVYLSFASTGGEGGGGNTTIARFKYQDEKLTNKEVLYKASPNSSAGQHFGSRLEFDNDGYLFFSVGDRGNRDVNPQDINLDMGKIYRIHDDGSIPEDNPFVKGDKPAIYSYGHRNPQGMAMNPETGEIWTHEHGPRGGDEVNIISKGKNYGWPILSFGINYSGSEFAKGTERSGMESPVLYWDPSIAPCGMTFVTGNKYPGWEGDLIVGALKFGYLVHATINGNKIIRQEKIASGIGRVRNVEQGPDGYLYVGVEGKGLYKLIMN